MIRSLFLIALYWSLQFVAEADPIPKEHLKEAIQCLREFFGEGIVEQPYRNVLTDGEYLGEICKDSDESNIEQKVISYDKSKNGHKIVQECLTKKDLAFVYKQFRDYAEGLLKNKEQAYYRLHGSQLSVVPYADTFSDLGKYTIGLCFKNDTVNFQDLKSRQDKSDAFNCSELCVSKFLTRIESCLYNTKDRICELKKNTQNTASKAVVDSDDDIVQILNNNMKILSAESAEYKFKKLQLNEEVELNIDLITAAKKYLITLYSEYYDHLDKYVTDKTLDRQLRNVFFYYYFCAKVECYMKAPESVPLLSLIHKGAQSGKYLKFYAALIGKVVQ